MAKSTRPTVVRLRPGVSRPDGPTNVKSYFMAAVLAIYMKDEQQRQRNMNVLLQLAAPVVNKDGLAQIQRSAVARLNTENGVAVTDVKDVVIQSISFLGVMTPEDFEGNQAAPVAAAAPPVN